jgi:hypothetical protein
MTKPDGAADAAADDEPVRDEDVQPEAETDGGPETVLVEHEGQTYELPAALKGALMRHADYTRKTQALAQARQELLDGHQAVAQTAEAHNAHLMEYARLAGLDDQIAQLSGLNWPALQQQDPAQAEQLMHQLFQMKQAREIAAGALQHKQNVKAFHSQREHARRVEQGHAAISRQIEGWSPERAQQLAQYALSQGISEEELHALHDPRLVAILHHACTAHEAEQQTSAAQKLTRVQAVRPAIQVGGTGGAPTDPNRMSTDDWMRHRRGQLRTKAK